MNNAYVLHPDEKPAFPPLHFRQWDPDDDQVPPHPNDPVLVDEQTAQVRQDDAFFTVAWDPCEGVRLAISLHPSDPTTEMHVTAPRLRGEGAMALARALVWAAYSQEGEPCDD